MDAVLGKVAADARPKNRKKRGDFLSSHAADSVRTGHRGCANEKSQKIERFSSSHAADSVRTGQREIVKYSDFLSNHAADSMRTGQPVSAAMDVVLDGIVADTGARNRKAEQFLIEPCCLRRTDGTPDSPAADRGDFMTTNLTPFRINTAADSAEGALKNAQNLIVSSKDASIQAVDAD